MQFRLDVFNAFNTVVINGRRRTIQYNSPTDLTVRNSQYLADGTLDPDAPDAEQRRLRRGDGAQTMRNMQLTARFSF